MCAIAYVDGKECGSQNELRHALGLKKLPMLYGEMHCDHCLCPVDIEKAARQAKYFVSKTDCYDWELKKH